jgi:hypothetical protein
MLNAVIMRWELAPLRVEIGEHGDSFEIEKFYDFFRLDIGG